MAALKPSLIDRAEDSDELYRLKAVILGDGTTGKTSLARRYIHTQYTLVCTNTDKANRFLS